MLHHWFSLLDGSPLWLTREIAMARRLHWSRTYRLNGSGTAGQWLRQSHRIYGAGERKLTCRITARTHRINAPSYSVDGLSLRRVPASQPVQRFDAQMLSLIEGFYSNIAAVQTVNEARGLAAAAHRPASYCTVIRLGWSGLSRRVVDAVRCSQCVLVIYSDYMSWRHNAPCHRGWKYQSWNVATDSTQTQSFKYRIGSINFHVFNFLLIW